MELEIGPDYTHFRTPGKGSPASSTTFVLPGNYKQTGTLNSPAYIEYSGGFKVKILVSGGEIDNVQPVRLKISANKQMQVALTAFL